MSALPANQLLLQLADSFPNLEKLVQDLQTSETELLKLSKTAEVTTSVELTLRLAAIRFQLLTAKLADVALTNLTRLMASDKHEVARRACNTVLTLAGMLPGKAATSKPWQKPAPESAITKQHMPTYSDSAPQIAVSPSRPLAASSSSPRSSDPKTLRPSDPRLNALLNACVANQPLTT
jgi:hypothetical protein